MEISGQEERVGRTLESGRLRVQVAAPGAVYRGSRFDWTGFVTQVTLDGRHTFCTKESFIDGKGTGGIGLCNEFGISQPVGYDDAQVGEAFPKLGVGLLTRPDDSPYAFVRPYPVEPYPVDVSVSGEAAVTFTVQPQPVRGYAVRLIKTLRVENNRLEFAYELSNVGEKTVATVEYGHNFVSIDRQPIGPGYRLRLPGTFAYAPPANVESPLRFGDDGVMHWAYVPQGEFYCRSAGSYTPGLQWELTHESGVGMRESVDFAPSVLALWGTDHVVSPEVFLQFELQPGETLRWTRQLEFFADMPAGGAV